MEFGNEVWQVAGSGAGCVGAVVGPEAHTLLLGKEPFCRLPCAIVGPLDRPPGSIGARHPKLRVKSHNGPCWCIFF